MTQSAANKQQSLDSFESCVPLPNHLLAAPEAQATLHAEWSQQMSTGSLSWLQLRPPCSLCPCPCAFLLTVLAAACTHGAQLN